MPNRRTLFAATIAGAAVFVPRRSRATCASVPLDRAAYDRYVALFNAADPRFTDYYDDNIKFVMNVRGKAGVLAFYARQRPYVKESLEILFFCSDATGAAAEVHGAFRCIKDCDDPTIFGPALTAGEVQRTHGYLLYRLNGHGKISEIKGPPPEVIQPWRIETS